MAYTTITAVWSGFSGGPGYSKFRFLGDLDSEGAAAVAARVRAFFFAFAADLPQVVNVSIQSPAQIYDAQHQLTDEVNFTPPAIVVGTNNQAFASSVGAHVNWSTGQVHAGRRVRGRTFLVPLTSYAFDTSGSLNSTTLTRLRAAAEGLVSGTPELAIAGGDPTQSTYVFAVTGSNVPDFATVLRSRRD